MTETSATVDVPAETPFANASGRFSQPGEVAATLEGFVVAPQPVLHIAIPESQGSVECLLLHYERRRFC
jgi:hypothetical protein